MPFKDPAARRAYVRAHPEIYGGDRHRKTREERRPSPARLGRFVGIDFETLSEKGWARPRVCLAQASNGERVVKLRDERGLSSPRIFEWLLGLRSEFGPSVFVGFGFAFDSNHALVSLPIDKLRRLHLTGVCMWRDYRIEFVPRKWLRVMKLDPHSNAARKGRSIEVDDCIGFFDGGFSKVLREWDPACPDLPIIEKGKAMRAEAFTRTDLPFLELYNGAEVRQLAFLMRKFSKAAEDAGLKLSRFYGAGCAAAELLKQNRIKETLTVPKSYAKELRAKTATARTPKTRDAFEKEAARPTHPDAVEKAALVAFIAGRSELLVYGVIREPLWVHDVNSQYPSIEVDFPNWAKGRWVRGLPPGKAGRWAFFRVEWDLPLGRPSYPFGWRGADGSICFPPMGRGWTTADELRAAFDVGDFPKGSVRVLDSWAFLPDDPNDHPFAFLRPFLERRLAFKNATPPNPAHYPMKVSANSCYGKLVQGMSVVRGVHPSFYHRPAGAFITGGGHAMLYRAARSGASPEERDATERRVVLFATDGIIVRGKPLPLPDSKALGGWGLTSHKNGGIFVQAGVYAWLDEKDRPIPQETRARGYLDRGFPWDAVRDRWASGSAKSVEAWARARFIGLGYCVSTGRWDLWLKFLQRTKKEVVVRAGNAGETKRVDVTPSASWTREDNPAIRPMRTVPWDPCRAENGGILDSTPYDPKKDRPTDEEVEGELAELSARDARHGWKDRPAIAAGRTGSVRAAKTTMRRATPARSVIPLAPARTPCAGAS